MRHLSETEVAAYAHVPREDAARARIVRVPVLAPGSAGMTLGRLVLLRHDDYRDGTSMLLAHELVHVRQWRELGAARFLSRYLRAYGRNLSRLRAHDAAYRAIPLEADAYAATARWAHDRAP